MTGGELIVASVDSSKRRQDLNLSMSKRCRANNKTLAGGSRQPGPRASQEVRWPLIRSWVIVVVLATVAIGVGWWGVGKYQGAKRRAAIAALKPVPSSVFVDQPEKREAMELADGLLREFPESPEAIYARGLLLYRFGQNDEAVKCWNACLALTSDSAPVYETLGVDAFRRGENEKAIQLLRKALELDPELPSANLHLGEALANLGRMEEAIPILQRAARNTDCAPDAHCQLAHACLSLNAYDRAKEHYLAALNQDPALVTAYYGLATVCERLGELDEAKKYREKHHARMQDTHRAAKRWARESQTRDRAEVLGSLAGAYLTVALVYETQGEEQKARQCRSRAAALEQNGATSAIFPSNRLGPQQLSAAANR